MMDPRKSYWSEMPLLMKICAPLTVIMIAAGAILWSRGYDHGIFLIGTPIVIICLRMFLQNTLEIGPQSIIGYTYDYWTAKAESAFRLPAGTITALLVLLVLAGGVIITIIDS